MNANELKFVSEGLKSFTDAFAALRRFQTMVCNTSRVVTKERLPELSKALGVQINPDSVNDYVNPHSLKHGWSGDFNWLGVNFDVAGLGTYYIGLVLERKDDNLVSKITAIVDVSTDASTFIRCFPGFVMQNHCGHEVGFDESLDPERPEDIEAAIRKVMGQWVVAWRSIGGINGLQATRETM